MDGNFYTYHVTAGKIGQVKRVPQLLISGTFLKYLLVITVLRHPRCRACAHGVHPRDHKHEADKGDWILLQRPLPAHYRLARLGLSGESAVPISSFTLVT